MTQELFSIKTPNQWVSFNESTDKKRGDYLHYFGTKEGKEYSQPWILVSYPYESWGCIMGSDLYLFPDDFPDEWSREERLKEIIDSLKEELEKEADRTVCYMNEYNEDYEGAVFMAGELEPYHANGDTRVILDIPIFTDKEDVWHDETCNLIIDCSSEKLARFIWEYL